MESVPADQPRRRRVTPRFGLRALFFIMAALAVLLATAPAAWNRYLRYRETRQYASLQAGVQWPISSLESFVIDEGRGVPDDFAILVRQGKAFGLFIPRNQFKNGEAADYDWYYRTDGLGRFSTDDPNVKSGRGSTGLYVSGGGSLEIKFGPFTIPWSGHGPGLGYVYFDYNPDPPDRSAPNVLRICPTDVKSVHLIDARDEKWTYKSHRRDAGIRGDQVVE